MVSFQLLYLLQYINYAYYFFNCLSWLQQDYDRGQEPSFLPKYTVIAQAKFDTSGYISHLLCSHSYAESTICCAWVT